MPGERSGGGVKPSIAALRARLDEFYSRNENVIAADSAVLAHRLYRHLHCRIEAEADLFAELAFSFIPLHRAFGALTEFARPRDGWRWNSDRTALRDECGIEVLPPDDSPVTDTPAGPVFSVPSVALSSTRQWLFWNSARGLPPTGYRVYVSATPDHAFDAWLATVKEVATSGAESQVKVAASPRLSERSDCIVAYSDELNLPRIIAAVRHSVDEAWLRDDNPGFSVSVGRGVSVGLSAGPAAFTESLGLSWSTRLAKAHVDGDAGEVDRIFGELEEAWDKTSANAGLRPETR